MCIRDRLSSTLELGGASMRDAIVAWPDVATAPITDPVSAIEQRMARSGHSRLALVDDADSPVGWVHAKDLLAVDSDLWTEPLPAPVQRQLIEFDHNTAVEDALERMQVARQHFAVATADGKPVGIITLEDVLEVLVSGLGEAGEQA